MSIDTSLAAALIRLAVDFGGGDAALEAKARAIVADPPTTLEEIGFYGAGSAPADERAVRAVVHSFSDLNTVYEFEDKYINEMVDVLIQNGDLPGDHGSDALNDFTVEGIEEVFEARDFDPSAMRVLADRLPEAGRALEDAIAKTGRRLVYIEVPRGDTLHYALVPPEVADRWRDVVLWREGDSVIAIRDPDWLHYWDFLAYALGSEFEFDMETAPSPDLPPYPLARLRTPAEAGLLGKD